MAATLLVLLLALLNGATSAREAVPAVRGAAPPATDAPQDLSYQYEALALNSTRKLVETFTYEFLMAAFFEFDNDEGPLEPTDEALVELVRLSKIFYRRQIGRQFPLSYQDVQTNFVASFAFEGVDDEGNNSTNVNVNFTTQLTFTIDTDFPGTASALAACELDEALEAIYIEDFVRLTVPADIFGL